MALPSSSFAAPVRAWFVNLSRTGWGGRIFWLTLVGVTVLLLISGYTGLVSTGRDTLRLATLGGLSGFAATAIGALLALALRAITSRTQDTMLGFAAGMMLAASSFR